jgi:hypothetical protein
MISVSRTFRLLLSLLEPISEATAILTDESDVIRTSLIIVYYGNIHDA